MVKSLFMKQRQKTNHQSKKLFINILLWSWMAIILIMQFILYPPNPFWNIAKKLNVQEPMSELRQDILPFFQTTDLNMDFALIFND